MTQQYKMTNTSLKGQVHSPMVSNMDEAVKYFQEKFPLEFIGSTIQQVKGINPQWGANFSCEANWATQKQFNAFVEKYGRAPKWEVFTAQEMKDMCQAEMDKEDRKSSY